jgi:hypothetical protein
MAPIDKREICIISLGVDQLGGKKHPQLSQVKLWKKRPQSKHLTVIHVEICII